MSINIMHASPALPFLDQYRFDVKNCEIAGILTRSSSEALLALAASHGGGNGLDLAEASSPTPPTGSLRRAASSRRRSPMSMRGWRYSAGAVRPPIRSSPR